MPHKKSQRDSTSGRFQIKDYRIGIPLYKQIIRALRPSEFRVSQDIDAYLAGFFDGEGHISISRVPESLMTYVEIGATQTDLRPLELLVKAYGGYIMKKARQKSSRKGKGEELTKPCYAWKCSGKEGMFALCRMSPWLIVKADKARAAIILLQNRPLSIAGGEMSPHQRMAISKALKAVHVIMRKTVKKDDKN